MAADYITEQMEEDDREAMRIQKMREAAIHIINGSGEKAAVDHVNEVEYLRDEAVREGNVIEDEDGYVDSYLDSELNPPSSEGLNEQQIYAIQQKLLEKYD
ncbi:hypothetical protein KZY42_004406 [Vibrio vulnificus]|nr:hypothetical protein [Vibrio vulnificus]